MILLNVVDDISVVVNTNDIMETDNQKPRQVWPADINNEQYNAQNGKEQSE